MTYLTYQNLVFAWMAVGAIVFLVLLKVPAPYGRHASSKWGPQLSNRLGWILMEAPGMAMLLYFVLTHASRQNAMTWTLIAFYLFHYINRTFIFPLRIHTRRKKMPVLIMLFAIIFNLVNGTLLGYFFGYFADYQVNEMLGARFIAGVLIFAAGVFINWDYDNRLIHLRAPGETGYKIPRGGLFEYVSCPNHLGEIIEWTGYAVMCWNLPAVAFLAWTVANLLPRTLSHHKWYKSHFGEYPRGRKAVVPWIL
jgi:3-oxo-5-alpha-steroid 4-dehydrogenase 1